MLVATKSPSGPLSQASPNGPGKPATPSVAPAVGPGAVVTVNMNKAVVTTKVKPSSAKPFRIDFSNIFQYAKDIGTKLTTDQINDIDPAAVSSEKWCRENENNIK